MTAARALLAEALGTGALTFATLGGAVAAADQASPLAYALTVGLALFLFITLSIPISGGHINPAVTFLFALRGEIAPWRAIAYVAVQILGAVTAVFALHLVWGLDLCQTGTLPRSGLGHFLSEVMASAGLALVIALGLRAAPEQVPVLVGGFAFVALWCLPSGGLQNPAVLVARTLTATPGGMLPEDLGPGLLAMGLGTLAGWASGKWLAAPDQA